jgi:hypothetical protein
MNGADTFVRSGLGTAISTPSALRSILLLSLLGHFRCPVLLETGERLRELLDIDETDIPQL